MNKLQIKVREYKDITIIMKKNIKSYNCIKINLDNKNLFNLLLIG